MSQNGQTRYKNRKKAFASKFLKFAWPFFGHQAVKRLLILN